jgi:nucleoid-associated protein YgaU
VKQFARFSFLSALALCGCDKLITDRPQEKMAAAQQRAKAGDFKAAIVLYESAIDGTSSTAEVHYRLAVIYDEKLKQPGSAAHHFQRYLDLAPKGAFSKEAAAYVKDARNGTQSGFGAASHGEIARLKNDNLKLQKQLLEYKQRVTALSVTAARRADETKSPLPPGARRHTVQSGETLASISQLYYRTRNRARDIQDANQSQLGGKNLIKPGQVLIIP